MASRDDSVTGPGTRRVVVGLASSEGLAFGRRLLAALRAAGIESHVVLGSEASTALGPDADEIHALAGHVYAESNQAARISSGSFLTRGMIVAPCDGSSLAAIVIGLATNLVYRAADVTLKEARPLVLGMPPTQLERAPRDILERAAIVPGLTVMPLCEPEGAATSALLAQLGIDVRPPA